MNDVSSEQLLQAILERAEEEPSEFRQLTSIYELASCFKWRKSTRLVLKVLKSAQKNLFKLYCKNVTSGISDPTQLVAFAQLDDVISFYEKELTTATEMIDEYEDYLAHGNCIYALFGGERF